jgi:hypothetical protein
MYALNHEEPVGDDLFWYGHVYDSLEDKWVKTGYTRNAVTANNSNNMKKRAGPRGAGAWGYPEASPRYREPRRC